METELDLPDLTLVECRFELMLTESGELPGHVGATLRGGIALFLKRSVCMHTELKYCRDCALRARCVYPTLFEPAPPPESEALSTHQDVPLPLVLRLPAHRSCVCQPGDALAFGLVLVGRSVQYLPYVVAAVEQLGQSGLGSARVRYRLEKAAALKPGQDDAQPIYEAGLMYRSSPGFSTQVFRNGQAPADAISALTLHFRTPTRLKHADRFVEGPPAFHVVVRALLRRVSSLSYFYGGQRWEIDYRGWISRAEAVQIAQADVRWVDWERYSTRQERAMNLGGIVGQVTYAGDRGQGAGGLGAFLPLLRLGELVHVGKAAVFGNGRYELEIGG